MVSPLTEHVVFEQQHSTLGLNANFNVHPDFDGYNFRYFSFDDENYASLHVLEVSDHSISQYLPKRSGGPEVNIEPWLGKKGKSLGDFYDLNWMITD